MTTLISRNYGFHMAAAAFIVCLGPALFGAELANEIRIDTPTGWRPERIDLPASFAPTMELHGMEEVRFAPGMFQPKSDSFFSYLFVFRTQSKPKLTREVIERELLVYYRGLASANLKRSNVNVDTTRFGLKLRQLEMPAAKGTDPTGWKRYEGDLNWVEPFVTLKPQTIHLEVDAWTSNNTGHNYLFACVSPQDKQAAIWKTMRELRVSFLNTQREEGAKKVSRRRRIIYNFDGDSCMFTRADGKGPVAITVDDMKTLIGEIAYEGSQVDTMLVCINAQVMYYPTKVGTLRGMQSTGEERAQWPAAEQQRFANMKRLFDAGTDPYAVMLAEAKRRGLEALLTFRVNDDHGNDFLRTKFWVDHPEFRLGNGALDFTHDEVREHIYRLIEEAVGRYDCDGIELDFNRFPTFFKAGPTEQRIAKINALVKRVRDMLDTESKKRNHRLLLAARVPSNYGKVAPSYATSRAIGCDPVAWAKNGWIDFLTVAEFYLERYDLPIAPWKQLITEVPIYGGIECTEGGPIENYLSAEKYRRAARHLWQDGADGIYLFNFFTTREYGPQAWEPPFQLLTELGTPPNRP